MIVSEAKEPVPINEQLSEILTYMKTFSDNIAQLNDKIDYNSEELFSLEKETQKTFDEIESKLCSKASTASCQCLANRISEVEAKLNSLTASSSKDALLKKSYSKRLHILIHGLAEDESTVWEKRETTLQIFQKFLRKGLQIKPEEISIADIHRLPQRPVLWNGQRKCEQIIVNLTTAIDKAKIFCLSKNLKSYIAAANLQNLSNSNENDESIAKRYVYVTDHLPKAFLLQKQSFMPEFKAARQAKTKDLLENRKWSLQFICK